MNEIKQFFLPTKIIYGIGTIERLSEEISQLKISSLMLVTGRKAMHKSGILDRIKNIVPKEIKITLYDQVFPEPNTDLVDKGLELAHKNKCELVCGLGGGSVIDVAKAIAGLINERDFASSSNYQEGIGDKKLNSIGAPFIAIPTTAGTGAEVTKNAVLFNKEKGVKKSIRSPLLFARTAIIDPSLSLSLSPQITAYSGMDALAHLIEGYISKQSSQITDSLAISGIRLVGESLKDVVENGNDISLREKMAMAALLGGMVIANSGPVLGHGVASCFPEIPHGLATAILLPYTMELNTSAVSEKFGNIAQALGERDTMQSIEAVKEIHRSIGIPEKLSDAGLKDKNIEEIADKCLIASSTKRNPKTLSMEEMIEFLEQVI